VRPFQLDPEEVAAKARSVARAAGYLRALDDAALARRLSSACARLAAADSVLGGRLCKLLAARSGLSPQSVRWGLDATFSVVNEAALLGLPPRPSDPIPLLTVMLSGNLFGSALPALLLPLWARVPVLAKASSQDDTLPRFLKQAIALEDPDLARCFEVTSFGHGHDSALRVFLTMSETLAVYGSDATVDAIRERLRTGTRLLAHGHGLGLAYIPASALQSTRALADVTDALSFDVAAYDQHGCLSPHAVLVEPGGAAAGPAALATALASALERRAQELPRGALDAAAEAEQLQWRGVARARGVLHAHPEYAVSYEAEAPLRASCGFRHVGVYDCAGLDALRARIAPLGRQLKALGYAGDAALATQLDATLPVDHGTWLTAVGQMQRPALAARLENRGLFDGLTR
jgi:hypothetical protein